MKKVINLLHILLLILFIPSCVSNEKKEKNLMHDKIIDFSDSTQIIRHLLKSDPLNAIRFEFIN